MRISGPAGIALLLGFFVMGVCANLPIFQPGPKKVVLDPLEAGDRTVSRFVHKIFNRPVLCEGSQKLTDFEREQCDEFWAEFVAEAVLCLIPLLITVLFVGAVFDFVRSTYKRVYQNVERQLILGTGIVTKPARASGDLYSWLLALRVVGVQLPNKTQVRVYLPLDEVEPLSGQTMEIYAGGNVFGTKRFFGEVRLAHVSVARAK